MASAYDEDRAALEEQRQAMLHAQEERSRLLDHLAARRSQASEAATSAEQECQQLTSEVIAIDALHALEIIAHDT